MKRRFLVSCSLWLLPLLAVRLLVPAGYMLAVTDGELHLVVCAGAAAPRLNAAAAHAHHEHHHEGAPSNHDAPAWHGDVSCPFAQLSATLPVSVVAFTAGSTPAVAPSAVHASNWVPQKFVHHTPIRGPPALS